MGLIWDLIQHGQIEKAHSRTETLEARVERLEGELHRTNEVVIKLLEMLEKRFGEDLNQDGRIG